MSRRQNLAAAAASFALAFSAAAAALATAATAGQYDVGGDAGMHRMMGGGMARMHHDDERAHEEMHELCHRMMAAQLREEERGGRGP